MKICYLADANSIHTKKICSYFIKKNHNVSVISLNDGYIEGATVYSMKMMINKKTNISKISYLKNVKKIKDLINKINPDIVHAHYATSYGLIGSLVNFKPYVLSVWGSDVYEFPQKSVFHKFLLMYNLKKANKILSTSNVMKIETQKYTSKNILVTPFGVNLDKYKPIMKKSNKKKFTIGTVKSLETNYGIEYLIRAFAIIQKKYCDLDVNLRIAGEGSQLGYLKELCNKLSVSKKVEFLGFLNQNDVIYEFQRFDVAVFPSINESFGVAAVEAQACGIPVIVSDVDGFKESTKPNVTGFMIKKKNEKDLVEKLDTLIQNESLRKKFSKNARGFVKENFDIEKNFLKIENIYEEIFTKFKKVKC